MSKPFNKGDKVVVDWALLFNSDNNYPPERRGGLLYEDDDLVIDRRMYEELSETKHLVVKRVEPSDNTVQFKQNVHMTDEWWLPAFCLKPLE